MAGILREQARNPAIDRTELRDLRQFLKQPLVGAAVQRLRDGLKPYSIDNETAGLLAVVRTLCAQQGYAGANPESERRASMIRREDLHLVCYEYIGA